MQDIKDKQDVVFSAVKVVDLNDPDAGLKGGHDGEFIYFQRKKKNLSLMVISDKF